MMRRLACAALLVSLACGGRPNQAPATSSSGVEAPARRANPFLELIPADTPYLYVSTVSSADYLRAELGSSAEARQRFAAALERLHGETPETFSELPPMVRALFALLAEVGPAVDAEGLARLGFDIDARVAIYGLGLMPVARFEIGDAEALDATVARIETKAGLEPNRETIGGRSVRRYDLDELELVMSFSGRTGVVALLPAGVLPEVAPALFGDERPARSVADARLLETLVERFGIPSSFVAYVDFGLLTRAGAGGGEGAAAAIARALDLGSGDSPCVAELLDLTRSAPRLVVGATVTADRLHAKAVLELAPELSRQIAQLRAAAPGLRRELSRGAALAVGVGIDVGAFIDLFAGKMAGLAGADYQCDELAWLPMVAAELGAALGSARATPLGAVRGASVIVRELDSLESPTALRYALAFVGSDDPAALVSLLAGLSGAAVPTLQTGDAPMPIPAVAGLPDPVHVAIGPKALGVSAGAGAESELSAILAHAPDPEPPLLLLRIAPKLAVAFNESKIDADYAALAAMDVELAEAMRDRERQDLLRYRELLLVFEAEPHGLALHIDFPYASASE